MEKVKSEKKKETAQGPIAEEMKVIKDLLSKELKLNEATNVSGLDLAKKYIESKAKGALADQMVQIKLFSAVKNFKREYKELTDEEFPADSPKKGDNGISQLASLIDHVLKQVVKEIKKQQQYRKITKDNLN